MNQPVFDLKIFASLLLLVTGPSGLAFAENSYRSTSGYQLAVLQEQSLHPEKLLLRQEIQPSDATIREFEWIIETLRHRCSNSEETLVSLLVGTWRTAQRRGYEVNLLDLASELSRLGNIASQAQQNQKVDFQRVALKWLKDKYPIKK